MPRQGSKSRRNEVFGIPRTDFEAVYALGMTRDELWSPEGEKRAAAVVSNAAYAPYICAMLRQVLINDGLDRCEPEAESA